MLKNNEWLRNSLLSFAALAPLAACGGEKEAVQSGEADDSVVVQVEDSAPSARSVENWPTLSSDNQVLPAVEARIDEIMSKLTLEQKVGQVIQADSDAISPADMAKYRLGSVLSGGNSAPGDQPYAMADDWVASLDALYDAAMSEADVEILIPPIFGIDAVHGHNNVIGGVVFPHNIGLGAMRDPALMREIAAVTAKELRATGHEWTFAPSVAVPQDDRWGRSYEGYSEDPAVVASYAGEIVKGLQSDFGADDFLGPDRVLSTAKHFLGDGGTFGGRDQGDARADEPEFVRIHNAGYPPAIRAGALSVMTSFSSWQGEKVHGDEYLMTDVLKGRMGFRGFIVGDWNAHGQVDGCTNENCPKAINAGLDMFMAPDSWRGLYENTLAQVKSGEIPMERLDDAVRRILRAKITMGLFEVGKPSSRPNAGDETILGSDAHRAVARRAVRQSLVLLKNENAVLPLARNQKVLIAGDGADSISKQSGGWTLSWQGGGLPNDLFPNGQSIGAGIIEAVTDGGGSAVIAEDGAYTEKPDVAIVVFGEDPYAEFQGDIDHVGYALADNADLELLQRLRADGVKTVAVFLSGRPLWVNPHLNASDAFVAAWLPGSEGGGIADVLFKNAAGEVNADFSGTLSFSWPKTAASTPLNAGQPGYDPLFPLGYGLIYGEDGSLAALSEDSGVANAVAGGYVYFDEGRFSSAWRLESGAAIQNALGLENTGAVTTRGADRNAQEDSLQVTIDGSAPTGVAVFGGGPLELRRETNAALELAIGLKVDKAPTNAMLGVLCADGADCSGLLNMTESLAAIEGQGWRDVRISLSCFADAGADMNKIVSPFAMIAEGGATLTISDIGLEQDQDGKEDCAFN